MKEGYISNRFGKTRLLSSLMFGVTLSLCILLLWQLPAGEDARGPDEPGIIVFLSFTLLALIFSVAGLLITGRLSRNPVGWSFLVVGLIFALGLSLEQYAKVAYAAGDAGSGVTALAWLSEATFQSPATFTPFLFFFYYFPTGRLPSRAWRPLLLVGVVSGAVLFIDFALRPERLMTIPVKNPLGLEALGGIRLLLQLSFITLVISLAASVVSLVVRFRRARGVERLQIKWFLSAAALFVVVIALAPVIFWRPETPQWIWPIALLISLALIPISAAVAIFRYRLYEIDLVINRALVYGALSALLAAIYVASIFTLQAASAPLTAGSDLAVAASTLAVAALFKPLRSRVQDFIDRRFYRRKVDAARTLDEFSSQLRDEVDLRALSSRLTEVVADAMQPTHVSLWVKRIR